jgi:hypothetical protein
MLARCTASYGSGIAGDYRFLRAEDDRMENLVIDAGRGAIFRRPA